MNKLSKLFLLSTLSISLVACSSSEEPADQKESEPKTEEKQETKKETVYKVGETWEVPNGWKLTVNSITPTDERNEYWDEENGDPGTVYVIDYTYTNDGYEDPEGLMDGLYFDLESAQIVDADGKMGQSYPLNITNYPQKTPVGATCDAQAGIAVENPGTVAIHLYQYLDGEEYKATFELTPEE